MPKRKADSTSSTANLIRVRNNQRRSRARRREYVAELERKIQECEANGAPTRSIVPEETLRRLQEENKKLRELLQQAGVEQSAVDRYINGHDSNTVQNTSGIVPDDVAHSAELHLPAWDPLIFDAGPSEETDPLPAVLTTGLETMDVLLADTFLNLPGDGFPSDEFGLFYDGIQEAPAFETPTMPQDVPEPSQCTTSISTSSSSVPADALSTFCNGSSLPSISQCDTESTLCSEAYEMLRQHNKKGVDMIEIGIRLWNGFTKGDGNGCKVENKLLFSVLEYVSG
ncbi:hypothetical protein BKA61DRAFT_573176 [Leptodontidium sp. MPI-SDFR-AT-0119]|nr:hypothetical protein BKA61DRAFT_573176 [Leptodontidium sp. MPI-SDFR-AT-0119]